MLQMHISSHLLCTLFDILHATNILHMDALAIVYKENRKTRSLDDFLYLILAQVREHATLHVQTVRLVNNQRPHRIGQSFYEITTTNKEVVDVCPSKVTR